MSAPRVSVVIPAYNAATFISKTIESALAQSFHDFEVIVVDDGSLDNTSEIVAAFGQPVRCIRQDNAGVSAARNAAIAQARGELIALLDHDDQWLPHKLEKQVQLFDRNQRLALVYSDCLVRHSNDAKFARYFSSHSPHRGKVFEPLLLDNFIPCLTVVTKKRALDVAGSFDPSLSFAEEWDLFLRIAEHHEIDFVAEPLAVYRVGETSLSRNVERSVHEAIEVTRRALNRRPELRSRLGYRLRKSLGRYHRALGRHYLSQRRRRDARQEIAQSLRLNPLDVRALTLLFLTYSLG